MPFREMPFHEKSAWIMTVGLLVGGVLYFALVFASSSGLGQLAPPNVPFIVLYTLILVVISIVGHAVVAGLSPRDANAPLDERERWITDRAGHLSGKAFGIGVCLSLALYLLTGSGNALFYAVFGSLMVAQTAEYALQIFLYRTLG